MPGNNQIDVAWVTVEVVCRQLPFALVGEGFQPQNPIGGNLGLSELVSAETGELVLLMITFCIRI